MLHDRLVLDPVLTIEANDSHRMRRHSLIGSGFFWLVVSCQADPSTVLPATSTQHALTPISARMLLRPRALLQLLIEGMQPADAVRLQLNALAPELGLGVSAVQRFGAGAQSAFG
jgi:hypothetical protein